VVGENKGRLRLQRQAPTGRYATRVTAPNLGEAAVDITVDVERIRGPMQTQLLRAAREAGKAAEKELRESGRRGGSEAGKEAGKNFGEQLSRSVRSSIRAIIGLVSDLGRVTVRALAQAVAGVGIVGALGAAAAAAQGLSAALIALVAAAAQAVGVLALLPAVLAGLGGVVATLAVGFQGMGDALEAVFAQDPAKLAEALKNLAPAAQAVVREFAILQPLLRDLRLQVQQQLFTGLAQELRETGQVLLPTLRTGLIQVADALRLQGTELLRAVRSGKNLDDIGHTFDNVAQAGRVLATAIRPAIDALVSLVAVGSDQLPGLAEAIGTAAQSFADFIAAARQSGALTEFFEDSLAAAADLGRLVLGLGRILGAVLDAGQETGAGLLDTLVSLTDELNRFLRSAEGQAALAAFFASARTVGRALLPVLEALATVVATDLAPVLAEVAQNLGPGVVATIRGLGRAVSALGPGLAKFAEALSVAFLRPEVQSAIESVGRAIGDILIALSPALGPLTQALARGLQTVAAVAPKVADALADLLITFADIVGSEEMQDAFDELLRQLPELIRLIGPVLLAVAPIMPDYLSLTTELLRLLIDSGLLQGLTALLDGFVEILDFLAPLLTNTTTALALLSGPLAPLVFGFANLDEAMTQASRDLQTFVDNLEITPTHMASTGQAIVTTWDTTWLTVTSVTEVAVRNTVGITKTMVNLVGLALAPAAGAVIDPLRRAWAGAVSAVSAGVRETTAVADRLPGQIVSALGNLGNLLYDAGRDLLNGFLRGIRSKVDEVLGQARSLAGGVEGAIRGALNMRSPSLVARDIGADFVRGLTLGLRGEASDVLGQARSLSLQLVHTMAAPTLPTSTSPVSTAGLPNAAPSHSPHLNIRVFVGSQELKDIVRVELDENALSLRRRLDAGVRAI
jgi:phage-related protein